MTIKIISNQSLYDNFRWLQSAKGTVLTMICSFGGGSTGLLLCYIFYGGHIIHIGRMVTTVMGSLVSYGAITFLCSPIETMAIGAVSALIVFFGNFENKTVCHRISSQTTLNNE